MSTHSVDYDRLAPRYDERYGAGAPPDLVRTLLDLIARQRPDRLLEVGCGTGYWLAALTPQVAGVYGVDRSEGMLARARERSTRLVRGRAEDLPVLDASVDLVCCINALHHFEQPARFIAEACRVLRRRGALCVVGMNPNAERDRWYLYDYFTGARDTDRRRYPSVGTIADWMLRAGFQHVEAGIAARIVDTHTGRRVLDDPILQKGGTSQLALLSDTDYAAGIERIEAALAANVEAVFPVDVSLAFTVGHL